MDARHFDRLTRVVAGLWPRTASRRRTLSLVGGFVLARSLGVSTGAAKTHHRKKRRRKKKRCLFGQRRCRDRHCHGCCNSADCGGNVCENGACSRCPAQQRVCRGGCIAETDCCIDAECDGGKTCIDGTCACRADQRLCLGACVPADTCCDSADCGGAACLNGQCQCPAGQQACRGECIPETSCCRTSDCAPCASCQDGVCVGGCPAGQECQNNVCRCPSGQKRCRDTCIPAGDCCTDADCGDLFLCADGTCVMGQGTCPAGLDGCASASGTCGQSPTSVCACFASTAGQTRCGANAALPGVACGQCVNDQTCRALYPDVPGVFCARGGPLCGCTDRFEGFCEPPCSD